MQKKINLNVNLRDLDDKELEDVNLGKMLGTVLASSNEGKAIKYISWAMGMYRGEEIALDPEDLNELKNFVNNTKLINNLAKAQILEVLDK